MSALKIVYVACFAMALVVSAGCATGTGGFNSAKKTNDLRPGMTSDEVRQLLGRPATTQYIDGFVVWRYSLQRPFVGWIPFHLAFDGETMTLAGWRENMDEYYRTQQLWVQSLPRQHHIKVDGQMRHDVQGTMRHDIHVW